MTTYPSTVRFEYGWEDDDGIPRGSGMKEQEVEGGRWFVYGDLAIVLTSGGMDFKLCLWDVADDLGEMFLYHGSNRHRQQRP